MISIAARAVALMLTPVAGACAGQANAPVAQHRSRIVTVMCNSTVSNDTGACAPRAEEKCDGKARLLGIVSNVEITGRPTGRLYTITARYECKNA
ncbi:hypothetical protein FHS96_005221 [Sphingomonas zeicaulis]|uniref:hypothetical protein n=1 Tax=Sphingomonas zeicaulis TaxID=1632740 RepID=UPI003D25C71F